MDKIYFYYHEYRYSYIPYIPFGVYSGKKVLHYCYRNKIDKDNLDHIANVHDRLKEIIRRFE